MIDLFIVLDNLKQYAILYYSSFFLLFLGCLFFNFYLHRGTQKRILIIIIVLLASIIGCRSLDVGTDTLTYKAIFDDISNITSWSQLLDNLSLINEPLFVLLTWSISSVGTYNLYLILFSLLSFLFTYKYCILLTRTEKVGSPVLLFFCMAIIFVFFNQQLNIIRSGLGLSFLFLYMHFFYSKKYRKALIFACLACWTHFSMILPILIILIVRMIKIPIVYYYIFYVISIVLAYIGWGVHRLGFLLGLNSQKIDLYIGNARYTEYNVGFRLDFVVFNTFFLLVFIWLKLHHDLLLNYYVKYYILTSVLFFLWFYIPYSDRIGVFSWNFISVILYIGICKRFPQKQVLYGSMSFLFLFFINMILAFIIW